jgi:hypothetical protein
MQLKVTSLSPTLRVRCILLDFEGQGAASLDPKRLSHAIKCVEVRRPYPLFASLAKRLGTQGSAPR